MCGSRLLTFVHVERNGADSDPDHALRMVEELNGLGVQGKIISVLCVGDRQGAQVSKEQLTENRGRAKASGQSLNMLTSQKCINVVGTSVLKYK